MRKRVVIPALLLVAVIAVSVGLYLFQPWRIFTSSTVIEDLPAAATPAVEPTTEPTEPAAPSAAPSAVAPVAAPRERAIGQLISHEHASSGTARILELPDGSRILRLEGLDTSDGPDLQVWLTDAPVIEGTAGWYVFDDGAYLDLGALKANKGDQNYEIPAAAELGDYSSVSIWCARFAVSFAAAELNT
ncbi:electron transfer DM13 family protein [Pseudarthrobacter siccitolerans]|uniref:Electron transfer DM13 family protein n=1 Tax=Pseudarthrobacter siccitolerans TaxID=861266 RepID=A0A024H4W1_9MICC|nr:DM13 domain-containing protein [Pseudarthrobacter siccitolerans]CCQ47210.1 electron transfer DM13 family protein [Pseudarthrobacter siccitolerans]